MTRGKVKHGEFTDGKRGTREYWIWSGIKDRCYRETCTAYPYYGGRGISMCDEWRADYSAFLRDMGRAPSDKHSIDRKDSDVGYSPSNCRWATAQEQAENQRRTKRVAGMLLTEVAKVSGMKYATTLQRFNAGLSEEAIFAGPRNPVHRKNARLITANGITKSETEWCREAGVKVGVVARRIANGVHPDIAVTSYDPQVRGESHSGAKIKADDVIEIRASKEDARSIATKYGITREAVYSIRSRRSWKHVE